jgi:hypothetical protein
MESAPEAFSSAEATSGFHSLPLLFASLAAGRPLSVVGFLDLTTRLGHVDVLP